jgi:hypothetical protein
LNIFERCNKIKVDVFSSKERSFFVKSRFLFLIFILIFVSFVGLAKSEDKKEEEDIYVVIEDAKGERLEGYLRFSPEELLVSTKDKQEKSVPLKNIEIIKLEKITGGVPGGELEGSEGYYSVKLQNSQELFTLQRKYTFSLKTSLGLVTQTVDPAGVGNLFQKDSASPSTPQVDKPFVRDRNVVFRLEFKF